MNPEVKTAWVSALRSGKYKQGHGRLRNNKNEYCCLGVLCDVLGVRWISNGVTYEYVDEIGSAFGYTPSEKIREQAGLEVGDFEIEYKGKTTNVIELNDYTGLSFEQIADLVEAQW